MIDVIIEMDKIQSFLDSGLCEVYSEEAAERISNHLKSHGYDCETIYRNTPIGEFWVIKKAEVSI
jgi:hypothetical protein